MPVLTGLYRYPAKSTAGEALEAVYAGTEGLESDRRFMLVRPDGRFISARTHPQLLAIRIRFDGHSLCLGHPRQTPLQVPRRTFRLTPTPCIIWNDCVTAQATTTDADAWVSRAVGEPAQLLWLGERSPRYREALGQTVSFADSHPLLLIAEASLEDLNARTGGDHVMAQFRPNLVVGDCPAFAEDGWQRLRIGEVVIRIDSGCSRCGMVGVDPVTARPRADKEPLRTLARYRRGADGQVYFGRNACIERPGRLRTGMALEIMQ